MAASGLSCVHVTKDHEVSGGSLAEESKAITGHFGERRALEHGAPWKIWKSTCVLKANEAG